MGLNIRQHDDLDRVPPGAAPTGRVAPWAWAWPGWQVVLAGGGVGLALLILAWIYARPLVYITFGVFIIGVFINVVLFVRVPGGYKVPTRRALQVDPAPIIERAQERDTVFAGTVSPPAQLTFAPTIQAPARAPESAAPPALPDNAARLIPDTEWRGWMDRAPHLLIAGRTDAGKTTLATALLIDRARAGDAIIVLDPHYQPGKWAGVPTIGGGRDFEDILSTLPQLIRELNTRYEAFSRGTPTEAFERLTVLIDEVPALVAHSMAPSSSGRQRMIDMRWSKFASRLGSEARKVRISVILMTQSTLVQDIMINSQLRDNYLRVGLGDQAAALLKEERDPALLELVRAQSHPAAMEWRGEYHALDTANVPSLAARPCQARAWVPPAPLPAQIPPTERVSPPPSVPTQPMTLTNQDLILDVLRARPGITSSEIGRLTGIDMGVLWKEINTLYGQRKIMRQRVPNAGKGDRYRYSLTPLTAQSQGHP